MLPLLIDKAVYKENLAFSAWMLPHWTLCWSDRT